MLNDFRYALRMLIKSPGFTIIAIVTLALGIGANSAIFSVINTVLLQPLPFPHSEQLAMIWGTAPQRPGSQREVSSYLDYVDLRNQNHSFTAIAAYSGASTIWGTGDESEDVPGLAATSDIFEALGTPPLLGRGYTREDDKPEASRVVVISYQFWQRRFAGDPNVLGKQVTLAGRVHTITGVMPRGWKFPVQRDKVEYLTPLEPLLSAAQPELLARRGAHFLSLAGRLKPGIELRRATADLQTITAQLARQYPDSGAGRSAVVVNLQDDVVGNVRPALLVLVVAVALVLLIACANVANLFLARAATREREIAIRTALGASRMRLVRQLLTETLLFALAGAAGGLLLAWWSIDALAAFGPGDLPRVDEIRINGVVMVFTFGIALLTTIVFGLVPALQASRPHVEQALKEGSRGSAGGVRSNRLRSAFVVSQFALSLVLLVGAGLLIRSFSHLRAVQPGFDSSRVLTFWQSLPKARYPEAEQQIGYFTRLLPKLGALPGIDAVGAVSPMPFSGDSRGTTFTVVGQPAPSAGMEPSASHLTVEGDYFRAMRIPLKDGRLFDARDQKDSPPVVMINEAFAQKFFPNQNPIGQSIIVGSSPDDPEPPREIVGIVGTSKHDSLSEPDEPEVYISYRQDPDRYLDIVVRTSLSNPVGIDAIIRRAVHEIDAQQFVPTLTPLQKLLGETLSQPRFNMALLGAFAGVAIILAGVGIYGVIAYNVTQRTKEIGIRMALGAQQTQMLTMILRQSLRLAVIGIVLGLAGAMATTRLMTTLLYGVGASDVPTYLMVILLLGAGALLATLVPARRAMKIDPMVALRYE